MNKLDEAIKELLITTASLVLTRKGDVDTEDGTYATVDTDTIIRLDYGLAEAFELDSDDVTFENMGMLVSRIRGLQLNINTREHPTPLPANKYHRQITGICGQRATIDVYRVLHAFPTGLPEIDHAVKKLLAPGMRGAKDRLQDLREAVQSIECAIKYLEQHSDE